MPSGLVPPPGMPLLSGPPPRLTDGNARAESSCRKCNKEFNIVFTRSRKCNHCGYFYCNSCADFQALMPRDGGYDPVPVCAFCIENLTITASGKAQLRSFPMAKLKKYMQDYDLRLSDSVLEKDDVIDILMQAREPNGCLRADKEDYYRQYSVPNRQGGKPHGIFSRSHHSTQPGPETRRPPPQITPRRDFARPDLEPDAQSTPPRQANTFASSTPLRHADTYASSSRPPPQGHQPQYQPPYRAPPGSPRPSQRAAPNSQRGSAPYQRPASSRPTSASARSTTPDPLRGRGPNLGVPPQRQRATSAGASSRPAAATPTTPPVPIPTLNALLEMSDSDVACLSIGTLKGVLFQNHVRAPPGLVLEKSELVDQVKRLVTEERRERAREAALREAEEQEIIARQHVMMEEHRQKEEERQKEREERERAAVVATAVSVDVDASGSEAPVIEVAAMDRNVEKAPSSPSKISPAITLMERSGLCVICQDEESNIAIMDCGHLCLCRGCSDLIMTTSRECPLCRTRIVTEARLLRIFKS